jgi:hypothetical protein
MRQRRVAAGSGLSTGLRTMAKYARRTASGLTGNGLCTTAKYLRRTRNGAVGNGLGTAIKYLRETTAASSAECYSPSAAAPRCRRQQSWHRPGQNDHVHATEATSKDPTSSKVNRRVCYLASVHTRLVIFTLCICSSAECSSLGAKA